jgi:hypothetical protein
MQALMAPLAKHCQVHGIVVDGLFKVCACVAVDGTKRPVRTVAHLEHWMLLSKERR